VERKVRVCDKAEDESDDQVSKSKRAIISLESKRCFVSINKPMIHRFCDVK
jgi:hypothetical protein